jgi:hypothetical protein
VTTFKMDDFLLSRVFVGSPLVIVILYAQHRISRMLLYSFFLIKGIP